MIKSEINCINCGELLRKRKVSVTCPNCGHVTWFDKEQRDLWIKGFSNKFLGEYSGVTMHSRRGMTKIKPGQLWLDDKGIWGAGYSGEMLYVVCSKEPNKLWVCMCFQEWEFGAYKREFNEEELNKLKLIGSLSDLKDLLSLSSRINLQEAPTLAYTAREDL